MDWFAKLTGFQEGGYNDMRDKLDVREGRLFSRVNHRSYGIGNLEMLSLAQLRASIAGIVLEAAYEATLAAALLNYARTGARTVFLTRLGGGAFGNDDQWIDHAMRLAFQRYRGFSLDIRLVSPRRPAFFPGEPSQLRNREPRNAIFGAATRLHRGDCA